MVRPPFLRAMAVPSPAPEIGPASLRRGLALLLAVALVAALTAGVAEWPWRGPEPLSAFARQVAASTGLDLTATGPTSVKLLPRPTVELQGASLRTRNGSVRVDAERLRGTLDMMALATGEVRLLHILLERPTVTLDADRVRAQVEPMLHSAPLGLAALLRTSGLTFRDGVIRVLSVRPGADVLLTDVSATFAWPAAGTGASLSGSATWRGTAFSGSVDLDTPDALLAGGESTGSLRLRSGPIDLQAIATLYATGDTHAVGRLVATTPDLPGFLRLIDHPAPQLGGFARARLDGRMSVAEEVLSISDATVGLDDMQFEGALAARRKGNRPALAATLATDHVDLGRFLGELPAPMSVGGAWAAYALNTRAIADDEVDLRVSAARATFGPLSIEDSSLSLQSGDGRLELSLGEARAYDGLLKARVVASVEGSTTVARLDAALSRLDLAKLMEDLGGASASGILTGRIGVEARGSSADAMVRTAQGRGEITLRDGALDPGAIAALSRDGAVPPGRISELASTFDEAVVRFGLRRGGMTLDDGWVNWPAMRATLSGSASLPGRNLDLRAVLPPDTEGDEPLAFGVTGPWGALRVTPARVRATGRPPS